MATVYEYYKTDFWYAFSLEASFEAVNERGQKVAFEKSFMLDLNVNARFLALYLPSCSVELVISVLEQVRPLLTFANNVTLGNRIRAGTRMELQSQDDFVNVHYHGPGETDSFNADEFPFTGRVFIYSAASIADSEWARIEEAAQQRHFKVVYRGPVCGRARPT